MNGVIDKRKILVLAHTFSMYKAKTLPIVNYRT